MRELQKKTCLSEFATQPMPSCVDIEMAILGAALIQGDAFYEVNGIIKSSDFSFVNNQLIYETIKKMHDNSDSVDLLTVINQLKKDGNLENAGGAHYVSSLTNRVSSAGNIEYHARIVKQYSLKRNLIAIGNNLIQKGYDDQIDCFDLIDNVNVSMMRLDDLDRPSPSITQLAVDFSKEQDNITKGGTNRNLTGFKRIDGITGGFSTTDLVILAARPAMGKTSLAMNIAVNMAKNKNSVGVFSLEMDASQLMRRMISVESGSENEKGFSFGDLLDPVIAKKYVSKIMKYAGILGDLPIHVNDKGGMSVQELRSKAIIMKKKHDIKVIIIDYIQLLNDGQKTKEKYIEVGNISRALKNIAKELKVTVIGLSQLSREVEKRGDKTPLLSDLRDSGSIEQDADIVMFITRPEYYGIMQGEHGECTKGMAKIIVSKNRNGSTQSDWMYFDQRITKFSDNKGFTDISQDVTYTQIAKVEKAYERFRD